MSALLLALLTAAPSDASRSAILAAGRPTLTLEAADTMANAAINEARTRGFNDVSVHVLDATGRTVVSKCMLNCPSLPHKLAHATRTAGEARRATPRKLHTKTTQKKMEENSRKRNGAKA